MQVDHGSVFRVDDFGQEASERKALGQKHTNDHVFRGGHHDDADDVGEGASGEEGPQSAHRLHVAYGLVAFRHLLFQPAERVPADDDASGNTHIDNRSDSKEGHDLSVVDRPHMSVLKVEAAPVEEAEADERGHGDSQQVGPVVQEPTDLIPFYHGGVGHAQVRHARMILVTKGQQRVVTGLPRAQVYRLLPLPHNAQSLCRQARGAERRPTAKFAAILGRDGTPTGHEAVTVTHAVCTPPGHTEAGPAVTRRSVGLGGGPGAPPAHPVAQRPPVALRGLVADRGGVTHHLTVPGAAGAGERGAGFALRPGHGAGRVPALSGRVAGGAARVVVAAHVAVAAVALLAFLHHLVAALVGPVTLQAASLVDDDRVHEAEAASGEPVVVGHGAGGGGVAHQIRPVRVAVAEAVRHTGKKKQLRCAHTHTHTHTHTHKRCIAITGIYFLMSGNSAERE